MRDMGRLLMLVGAAILLIGFVLAISGRVGGGHLPGDLVFRRGNFTFYFPLLTSIIVSVVLTLLIWLFRR